MPVYSKLGKTLGYKLFYYVFNSCPDFGNFDLSTHFPGRDNNIVGSLVHGLEKGLKTESIS